MELGLERYAKPLIISAALLGACDQTSLGERAIATTGTSDTLARLQLASDPGWQLLAIDSLGLSLRTPKHIPLDIRGQSAQCLAWTAQPSLYTGEDDTFVPVYFSTGSLGEALQSVGIGYHDVEGHYVSYGRMGAASRLEVYRGLRSLIFSGTRMVGVPISEEGGMALDEVALLTAILRRPDGCWVIFTFDEYADVLSTNVLWHVLETVRFTGEDVERTLPGQRFVGPFIFHERLREVVMDSSGSICMLNPPPGVSAGVPVAVLRRSGSDQLQELLVPDDPQPCAHAQGVEIRPPFYEYASLHSSEGIGLIAPAGISLTADSLAMDLDGDGIPERLDGCVVGDSTEYRIVERSPTQNTVHFRIRSAERVGYESCRN